MNLRATHQTRSSTLTVAVAVLGFITTGEANAASQSPRLAYIDPGAGSFLLQAVVAMFAGAVVALSTYWTKVKQFLGLAPKNPDPQNDVDSAPKGD